MKTLVQPLLQTVLVFILISFAHNTMKRVYLISFHSKSFPMVPLKCAKMSQNNKNSLSMFQTAQNKMIKMASANALRIITNKINIYHTHTQIHQMTNRALPDQILKYKHALMMHKLLLGTRQAPYNNCQAMLHINI